MGVPYIDSGVPDIRDLPNVTLHNTKANTLETIGTITGGDTTVTSLTSSGEISGGDTTVTSLSTEISGQYGYGAITGGVTSVTELKTNTIYPATGQVTTTFPYDVHCRDMNVNVKLVTDTIVAPNGSTSILINNTVHTSGIYTNIIHAPTSGPDYNLQLKGGMAWAANILIERWYTYYRADRHYFYRKGGNFDNLPINSSHGVFFNGNVYWQSDDRLKHNEEDITDALGTIRKLNAQKYQKTDEPKEADFNGELTEYYIEETGFIAQDVMEIPELAYCVTEGVTAEGKDIYNLKYNDIFVVNVQAVKELDAIVQSQQTKIDSLEARLAALESRNES
tara:strand:+ start:400 stop:1407 length:1008 start_codon:yes stop_codon:yes gene_type:complete